jgi:hypothetical protein
LNPDFTKIFLINYFFEKEQVLRFQVFDIDNGSEDFIGQLEVKVGDLMVARDQTF